MAFTVNGVLQKIVTANGTLLRRVYANGVQVFQSFLHWTGSSKTGGNLGLDTNSAEEFRWQNGTGNYGATLTATYEGLGVGTSEYGGFGFSTTATTWTYISTATVIGVITYTPGVGFTGSSITDVFGIVNGFKTSGGGIYWSGAVGGDGPVVYLNGL